MNVCVFRMLGESQKALNPLTAPFSYTSRHTPQKVASFYFFAEISQVSKKRRNSRNSPNSSQPISLQP